MSKFNLLLSRNYQHVHRYKEKGRNKKTTKIIPLPEAKAAD